MKESNDYWEEAIAQSAEEHSASMTSEQVALIAKDIRDAHEMYGEAHGHHHIPDPRVDEIKKLEAELKKERGLRFCEECHGRGCITYQGPHHGATTDCWKCRGKGKL